MANVAVVETSTSNPFGRFQANAMTKRKTPSELRGEQLKRRSEMSTDLQPSSFLVSERSNGGVVRGLKKPDSFKIPRYIETRVDVVYPVKKSSERCRILYGKENSKDALPAIKKADDLKKPFLACNFGDKNRPQQSCEQVETPFSLETPASFAEGAEQTFAKGAEQSHCKVGKCSQSKLLSVSDLSSGCKRSSDAACIDMDKALKGLVAREFPATSNLLADSSGLYVVQPSLSSRSSEFHIAGNKAPLDLTLKTTLRLVSSSSVKWCHREIASSAYNEMCQFNSQFFYSRDQNVACKIQSSPAADILYSKGLRSWVYPQSTLPPLVVSAMTLSASRPEKDFLMKRQQDWEDSFRSIYYMLRKNLCNIFYVYTSQFVVMFIGGNFLGKKKRSSNAYVSQSTHGLRSLLQENDISFSMPLCRSEVEQATADDLVEFSEMKQNLGQTLHLDPSSDLDKSPESLLAFIGNKNVHGLFDFLLNYRFYLRSLTGVDVPVIYSPVPFQNGSICTPEVRCKEMKRADVVFTSREPETNETESMPKSSANDWCYSIEIKDSILPPWTVSQVCGAMGSDERNFDLSLMTEPISVGLNVALDSISCKSDPLVESFESGNTFGIPNTVVVPCLRSSAFLKGLKYSNGSSMASVSPN